MRQLPAAILLAACIAAATGARATAQDASPLARAAMEQGLTVVSMSESAQRELRRDRLRIELRAEQAGRDPARVQAEVNRVMAAALARARAASGAGLRVETGGYAIHQERVGDTKETTWRARQGLSLSGTDAAAMLQLAGQLQQDGLLASGMGWELGDEARRAAEQELLGEAIARLRTRADAVAAALGGRFLRFATVAVDPQRGFDRPMPRMAAPMAMASPAAAPEVAAEAGMEVVRVAVQAEALLGQGR